METTKLFRNLMFFGLALVSLNMQSQSNKVDLRYFDKIIVNPHIQVTFVKGNEESVTIDSNTVSNEKLNIEVKGKTLHLYLDGARVYTKSERYESEKWKGRRSIYKGTVVTATVTYTSIDELSLRGEEVFVFQSPIVQEKLRLKVYGDSNVYMNTLELDMLHITMYGEGQFEVKKGEVANQKVTCYGECKVNTTSVMNRKAKVLAFGEAEFELNVVDDLKVSAYGEAKVKYIGNPNIDKGIVLGSATISKI